MNDLPLTEPLTDDELDRLGDFLDGLPGITMNVEMIDGFFTALICGPDLVSPDEYLPAVWGEDFVFDREAEAHAMLALLMRHWNDIAGQLRASVDNPDLYVPVLMEDDEGIAHGNDWASGFMLGVEMRLDSWDPFFDHEAFADAISPILLLHHELDPDPKLRTPPLSPEEREDTIPALVEGVTIVYRLLEPARLRGTTLPDAPIRREGPKVGRNDPCPCGSGRKYKQCCGAN
jgi:uncharacterized protein